MKFDIWAILAFAFAVGIQAAAPGLGEAYPKLQPLFTALAVIIAAVQTFLGPAIKKAADRLSDDDAPKSGSAGPLGIALFCAAALSQSACVGLGSHAVVKQSDERCDELERRYEFWGGVAGAAYAFAGGGALTTSLPEELGPRFAIGVGSAVIAGIGAYASFVRDDVNELWGTECEGTATSSVSG